MPASDWYDMNTQRAYPFVRGTVRLPESGPLTLANLADDVVADAGFVVGPRSGFETGVHSVYLSKVRRTGDFFYLEFSSDAPGLASTPLVFTRSVDDNDYKLEYADSGTMGLSDVSDSASGSASLSCDEPLWYGFLVHGRTAALESLLAGDGAVDRGHGSSIVEPALVQNLALSQVTRFILANDDRTRVSAPAGCEETVFPYQTDVTRVYAECVVGDVVFKPGYNCGMRVNAELGSLTFLASVGAGEGEPCDQVRLFADETPPAGSNLLEGGLRCNEVLRSINGVGGRQFTIEAGPGVTISARPEDNVLVVAANMSGLAVCDSSSLSESC
jgi:hypothetical protein